MIQYVLTENINEHHDIALLECFKAIYPGCTILAGYCIVLAGSKEHVELGEFFGITAVFRFQYLDFLVLVDALYESFEADAGGAVSGIIAVGIATAKHTEAGIRERMTIPVDG